MLRVKNFVCTPSDPPNDDDETTRSNWNGRHLSPSDRATGQVKTTDESQRRTPRVAHYGGCKGWQWGMLKEEGVRGWGRGGESAVSCWRFRTFVHVVQSIAISFHYNQITIKSHRPLVEFVPYGLPFVVVVVVAPLLSCVPHLITRYTLFRYS